MIFYYVVIFDDTLVLALLAHLKLIIISSIIADGFLYYIPLRFDYCVFTYICC